MLAPSPRLSIAFSWIGHAYMHILSALYLTVVLVLEDEWRMGYDDLIRLWTLGSFCIGLGAPLAGWLGDRWSESRMMVVYFLLTGGGAVMAGLADGPDGLFVGLALLGLGASIYHPVGMAWLLRNAVHRGRALAWQGVFGSLGTALPALVAGTCTALWGWRAAFLVPGAVCIVTGLALLASVLVGLVVDPAADARPEPPPNRGDALRVFLVLTLTMACGGLIWNSVQVLIPKWFEASLGTMVGESTLGVGGMVTAVYLLGTLPQLVGGRLGDRLPPRRIYLACLASHIPVMALAATITGTPVLLLGLIAVSFLSLQIPVENLLLARYTPARRRGLAFGAKFILTFGLGPVAVQMVALFWERTGSFSGLFLTLAGLATAAALAALMLPRGEENTAG